LEVSLANNLLQVHNNSETRNLFPVSSFENPSAKATTPSGSERCLFGSLRHAQTPAILPTNLPYRLYPLLGPPSRVKRQLFAATAREPNAGSTAQDNQEWDWDGLKPVSPHNRMPAPS